MKQKLLFLLVISFLVTCLSGCLKKGEDDPMISLRTRKNRLVGKWEVKTGSAYSKFGSWSTSEETFIYTSSSYQKITEIQGGGAQVGPSGITNGSFSYTLEFKKDGDFNSTQITDGYISTLKGTWNFTAGVGKEKNNDKIVINIDSWTNQPSVLTI